MRQICLLVFKNFVCWLMKNAVWHFKKMFFPVVWWAINNSKVSWSVSRAGKELLWSLLFIPFGLLLYGMPWKSQKEIISDRNWRVIPSTTHCSVTSYSRMLLYWTSWPKISLRPFAKNSQKWILLWLLFSLAHSIFERALKFMSSTAHIAWLSLSQPLGFSVVQSPL